LKQGWDAILTVNGTEVVDPSKLPTGPLRLTRIAIPGHIPIQDAELEHLQYLDSLDHLHLGPGSNITDQGLSRLAEFPFTPGLVNLMIRCPTATEVGLAHFAGFRNLQHLHLSGQVRPTSAGLAHLGKLTELTSLAIDSATIPANALETLRNTKLTRLTLVGCQITAGGLNGVGEIPTLTHLYLVDGTKCNESALQPLQSHPILTELHFSNAIVPDDALVNLRGLPALHLLNFFNTGVGDSGIGHLTDLAEIRTVYLSRTRITSNSLPVLAKWNRLEVLDVAGTSITDTGLEHLESLKHLRSLNLAHTKITDTGLAKLQSLKSIRELNLVDTQITADGVRKLKAAWPECVIHNSFGL
jgi:Leucine-rich repeat (LRR) protein